MRRNPPTHPGGPALVGEYGPEVVDLPPGSAVTPTVLPPMPRYAHGTPPWDDELYGPPFPGMGGPPGGAPRGYDAPGYAPPFDFRQYDEPADENPVWLQPGGRPRGGGGAPQGYDTPGYEQPFDAQDPLPPRFHEPELEQYKPQGFWESINSVVGDQGIQTQGQGLGGLALLLGSALFNTKNRQAGGRRREVEGRNAVAEDRAGYQNRAEYDRWKEQLGMRRDQQRRAVATTRATAPMVEVTGHDGQRYRVPASSTLGQRHISTGSTKPPPPRAKAKPSPSGRVSTVSLEGAKARLKAARDTFRAKYWARTVGNDPTRYSMFAGGPIPPEAMQEMEADPEVAAARDDYDAERVVTIANAAKTPEDIEALRRELAKFPAGGSVRSNPAVVSAAQAAAARAGR